MSLGVGIVGYGSAGRQHAAALNGMPDAMPQAVWEPNVDVDSGPLRRTSSWTELLQDESIGLISLCVPPGGRARLAVEALEAGKAVLLEKPPTVSPSEIDLIMEASQRSGNPVGVMLQHRMRLPESALAAHWAAPSVTAVLEVSRFRPPGHYRRAGWRRDPGTSFGGIAAHLGVHYLDLACQMLGHPESVHLAASRQLSQGIDTRVTGVIEYHTGATLAFTVTAESTVRTERLQILSPRGALCVTDGIVNTTIDGVEQTQPTVPTTTLRRAVYQEMVDAVSTGRQPARCSLEGTRGVTKILASIARGMTETT